MFNVYQLQSFVTVIGEGSMTAAADKLFLTQPAISQQIRNLEESMGVELLVRGVRQIKPTLQGEVLYGYAKRILQLSQQAEIAVKTMGVALSGRLKVGTLNSLGVHLMSPIVARLLKYNPKLSVNIDYAPGEELIQAFERAELDVLILPEIQQQFGKELKGIQKKFLMKEEMWLTATGRDSEIPQQIGVSDLAKYPFIGFNKEYPHFQASISEALHSKGVQIHPTFESPNVGTLKRVIESGLGWGFLPSLSIVKQVKAGRLVHIHLHDFSYNMEFYFYFSEKTANKELIEVFFQALHHQERN
jgi:LysR family transcriptional regulator, transcriptional activator of the cysJI operon